jgi:hypothetical protein
VLLAFKRAIFDRADWSAVERSVRQIVSATADLEGPRGFREHFPIGERRSEHAESWFVFPEKSLSDSDGLGKIANVPDSDDVPQREP